MWIDAGFDPDAFWHQTPRTFQLIMQGVRKRGERATDDAIRQAWDTANMSVSAQAGKLKPLRHYLSKSNLKPQTPSDMLAMIKAIGVGTDMKITRIRRET